VSDQSTGIGLIESRGGTVAEQMIADQFQNVLAKGRALNNRRIVRSNRDDQIENEPFLEWHSQSLTLLLTVFGPDHPFTKNFEAGTMQKGYPQPFLRFVQKGMGVLVGAEENFLRGWNRQYREILHAEVFDDILEMADHLLTEGGYVDAAAVLAGGALEGHLRSLSQKHNVPIGKASAMNEELWKKGIYTKPTWRMVQGWYDLRSDAAHQSPGTRSAQDVTNMITGVRSFISQYPA
jgi:hypothetical protein